MKHRLKDYKLVVVRTYLYKSYSLKTISRAFDCSKLSLWQKTERFQCKGSIRWHNGDPVSYKAIKAQAWYAVENILDHQPSKARELYAVILAQFPDLNITPSHLMNLFEIKIWSQNARVMDILRNKKVIDPLIVDEIWEFFKILRANNQWVVQFLERF